MGIKSIIDGSQEGVEIDKELNCKNIKEKLTNDFIIRWGNWIDKNDDSTKIEFNSSHAIKNTIDKEGVLLILRKHGMKCPQRIKPGKKTEFPIIGRKYYHKEGTDIKIIDSLEEYKKCDSDYFVEYLKIIEEYRVHVMDTDVFFIEEKYCGNRSKLDELVVRTKAFGWEFSEINLMNKNEEDIKNIINLAKKAVYSIGLDFGVVNIGKTLEGIHYVLDVDATCQWSSEKCREAYINQFKKLVFKYDNLVNNKSEVTIGADIECVIKDKETGALIFASDFFSQKGSIGMDARSIEADKEYFPIMEIRPGYSINPIEVIDSVKSILNKAFRYINYKNIGVYAGNMPVYNYWVGGHVHFGVKPNIKFIRALDNYLALPLMMIEKVYSSRKRKAKYGSLGNYRLKFHKGFEYCTLSSWVVDPETATAVLHLAKVIAQEYFNLKEEFLCNYSDIRAFYLVEKFYFKDKIEKILYNISNTKTFKKYSSVIEPLFKKILLCEEWEEDKDIKEAWNLKASNKIYNIISRCFIPKNKRKELGVSIGQIINIVVGANKYKVQVFPKDDFSLEKNGYVSFSKDICKEIGIEENDNVGMWFDSNLDIYRVGPVLAILSDRMNYHANIFGPQTYYFRKLIKLSRSKGMITYVVAVSDVDWGYDKIKGYAYDFDKEEWKKQYFTAPNVFYNRWSIISTDSYSQYEEYIKYIQDNEIKFINSPECMELTNDKWKTYLLLSGSNKTNDIQPKSWEYNSHTQLKQCIEECTCVFIKLKYGSKSTGLFYVERLKDSSYMIIHNNIYDYTEKIKVQEANLMEIIDEKIEEMGCINSDYIIQQKIPLIKYKERNFEIRVIMQKNSTGKWIRTCMIARCTAQNENFITLEDEIDLKSSVVLSACFDENAEYIGNQIRERSKDVVSIIDDKGIQAGELAIDFGIDENFNIFIIELNSKPDNLLYAIGALKTRNLAMYRILEYAKFLSGNNTTF
ncbi:putative amidoligase domain-containing protein [Clostridium sp. ZS2-4]|uniref:putative amidoligase domain-containing protein n=1 Tax=Clostridium sp. ZS2-4 TaxID=2987703 RepID=UPI00227C1ACD|nr:YheC/YheD family protein [Clostridium sp. ZS2-4]MCY6354999.1 YheC/YheD family protein [Clostridium sp. ZS2-4]